MQKIKNNWKQFFEHIFQFMILDSKASRKNNKTTNDVPGSSGAKDEAIYVIPNTSAGRESPEYMTALGDKRELPSIYQNLQSQKPGQSVEFQNPTFNTNYSAN